MTDAQYQETQAHLLIVAAQVATMDLNGFLERINLAETTGPILDPTLYLQAGGNLAAIRTLAEGAQQFQKAVLRVQRGRSS